MPRISFVTFGCKVNYAETIMLKKKLEGKNETVDINENPEIVIINSCSVTDNAARESLQTIKKISKNNPNIKLIITGCQSQLQSEIFSSLPNVIGIFGNQDKEKIFDFINNFSPDEKKIEVSNLRTDFKFHHAYALGDRTRCFLKIQDGCNYHCSYCATCFARGNSRSDTIESIVEDVKFIQKQGTKEIVLTGINIGDVGLINNKRVYNLYDLLKNILEIEDVPRLRISSIEMNLLTKEIIALAQKNSRLVNHFHIPLQSGNNEILKSMRRRYTREDYRDKILFLDKNVGNCCLGCDVIVGYPGETDEKFEDTYNLLQELPMTYFHVFPFSKREGTLAATYSDVDWKEKRKRVNILRTLSRQKKENFYRKNIGRVVEVLFECTADKNGNMIGFSNNYIRVVHDYDVHLGNRLVKVEITDADLENGIAKCMIVDKS
ncbi:MAG: tRNA (N(6)-L-threonylcarbamoyladenosine(37)-C(2))-methylthiotransferase MtaB [Cytophagales bacterium]|nr:tRNA (N(6)-L-threonylcarbamoyladenosine(37)-C(2))-methylthiotransferase MtaB [Cytophagales bacterium]